jgi:hypothetical protein
MADSGDQHQECQEWAAWARLHHKVKQDAVSLQRLRLRWDLHRTCKEWAPRLGGQEDRLQAGPDLRHLDGKVVPLRHHQQDRHRLDKARPRWDHLKEKPLGDHQQQGPVSMAWPPHAAPSRCLRATQTRIMSKATLLNHRILRIPSFQISRQHTKQLSPNGIVSRPPMLPWLNSFPTHPPSPL